MHLCKRLNIEVEVDSLDQDMWDKYTKTGEKHFPVCEKEDFLWLVWQY